MLIYHAAPYAHTTCVNARSTTGKGNPASKKPTVVPKAVESATSLEIKIATIIATCDASVNDIGSIVILIGEIIGIIIPIATSIAVKDN